VCYRLTTYNIDICNLFLQFLFWNKEASIWYVALNVASYCSILQKCPQRIWRLNVWFLSNRVFFVIAVCCEFWVSITWRTSSSVVFVKNYCWLYYIRLVSSLLSYDVYLGFPRQFCSCRISLFCTICTTRAFQSVCEQFVVCLPYLPLWVLSVTVFRPLASTPLRMPGTHPLQYFGCGGCTVNGNSPSPNIITYFWI